jgi:nucleoside-diphosphate-sugar epimerase
MTDTQIVANAVTNAPMSVFLTGATGALGRVVMRQLIAAGHGVTGTVATSAAAAQIRAAGGVPAYPDLFRAGELRSAIVGSAAKIVLNLAPQLPNHLPQHPDTWDERIAEATITLVEAAQQAGVEFLVHTSYAFADARAPEAAALLRAVRASEQAVLNGEVPACVLRFGFLYGSESDALIEVRDKLKLGRPVPLGADDVHAHWIYLGDAARALVLAAQRRPAGALLNIIDDQPASPAAFIRTFAQGQDLSAPSTPGNMSFLARPMLSKTQLALMNLDSHADNAGAKEQLGWTPRFPSYREGIEDTLLSWRAQEPVVL